MKKVIYNEYGDADQLRIVSCDSPVPSKGQSLIKVKAVSINPLDWKIRKGEMKLFSGRKFPKGVAMDFSGIIERADPASSFKAGDTIFGAFDGFKGGALAEYVVASDQQIAAIPDEISFEQAAALPATGAAAIRALELGGVEKGTGVLINGASGGVGVFATQIAKQRGATVTGVVSSKAVEMVRSWGCDVIVDYTEESVLDRDERYDVVVDLSDKLPFGLARRIMKKRSVYINTIPTPVTIITSAIRNFFSGQKNKPLITHVTKDDLVALAKYAAEGLDIEIHQTYSLEAVTDAYKEAERGGTVGKSVVTLP